MPMQQQSTSASSSHTHQGTPSPQPLSSISKKTASDERVDASCRAVTDVQSLVFTTTSRNGARMQDWLEIASLCPSWPPPPYEICSVDEEKFAQPPILSGASVADGTLIVTSTNVKLPGTRKYIEDSGAPLISRMPPPVRSIS